MLRGVLFLSILFGFYLKAAEDAEKKSPLKLQEITSKIDILTSEVTYSYHSTIQLKFKLTVRHNECESAPEYYIQNIGCLQSNPLKCVAYLEVKDYQTLCNGSVQEFNIEMKTKQTSYVNEEDGGVDDQYNRASIQFIGETIEHVVQFPEWTSESFLPRWN